MSGLIGIFAFDDLWSVSRIIYYGLLGLQHRGQERAGIATSEGEDIHVFSASGLVDRIFDDIILDKLRGWYGIGAVSANPSDEQPVVLSNQSKKIALVFSGNILNREELAKEYNTNKNVRDAYLVALCLQKEINEAEDFSEAGLNLVEKLRGVSNLIAINNNGEMIVYRDEYGLKPLVVGSFGFDYGVFASESCAIDVIGADLKGDVHPGEFYYLNQYTVERKQVKKPQPKYCAYEYVYLARPDSRMNGIWIYDVRRRIGEILAEKYNVDADVVVGIPDTAVPFSMAYANKTRIPVELGFISTGRKIRTAIKPNQFERLIGVQLKLNPIKPVFRGKRVLIIDDSVVRGTTTKNTVSLLRNRIGAKEVHIRVGSPRIVRGCPYGIEIPPRDELIAAHLSNEEVAVVVGADSFHWISNEDLIKAIGLGKENICLKCFGGD